MKTPTQTHHSNRSPSPPGTAPQIDNMALPMTPTTIEQIISVVEDGGFGFSPTIIAVPYLTAELRQRDIHLSTLEMHDFLQRITNHFRYGKIKWLGKAPLVYAQKRLQGATTNAIREELWQTERYATFMARKRERDAATRRYLALSGKVVEIRKY